jgi:hypothetical protein
VGRHREALAALVAVGALTLAGCAGTDPATVTGDTAATLRATAHCPGVLQGEVYFQYQGVGTSTWTDTPHRGFECHGPAAPIPLSERVEGLEPGTTYRFRLGVRLPGGETWADADGHFGGTNYDVFSTPRELALPKGGTSGFSQAADFYDSVGVNTHFWAVGTQYQPSWGRYAAGTMRLAELGVRHIRDMTVGSWFDWRYKATQPVYQALDARNRSLPAGQQPIFVMGGAGDWNTHWSGPVHWQLRDWFPIFDGGHPHYDGDPGVQPGGGNIPRIGAPVPDRAWPSSQAEIPWTVMDALEGPNEPTGDLQQLQQLKPWMAEMTAAKQARASRVAAGGLPYVTESGVQPGPAHVDQLPTVGVASGLNPIWSSLGDWSKGTGVVDVGDVHVYWGGSEPAAEGYADQLADADTYNGDLSNPPDRFKGLPMVVSETGYVSRGVSQALTGPRAGFWPAPDDVIAEYLVRSLLGAYRQGFRRSYVYELMDQLNDPNDAERNFGLIRYDGAPKPQFYAIKNLLAIVGFRQAPPTEQMPIPVSVSGFQPGPGNQQTIAVRPTESQPLGAVYHQTKDRLDTLLLQQSADTYLYFVWRQASLWDREQGNRDPHTGALASLGDVAAGRTTPDTQNLTVHLPPGVASVSVAEPTAGQDFSPLPLGGDTAPLQISGKTKVLKIVMAHPAAGP